MPTSDIDGLVAELRDQARDVCTPAELLARIEDTHRHRRSLLMVLVAAVVVAIAVLATLLSLRSDSHDAAGPGPSPSSSPRSAPSPLVPPTVTWRSWHDRAGITIRYPSTWVPTPYHGVQTPVLFVLVYFSEHHLGGPCSGSGPTDRRGPTTCFDGTWSVPRAGVIVGWRLNEIPVGSMFEAQPGRRTTIDHHRAKVYIASSSACGRVGATEIDAAIKMSRDPRFLEFFAMHACVGPDASARDRAAVLRMLHSVRITRGR